MNRFGSSSHGSIVGNFLLAMIPRGRPTAAFIGLIVGMGTVASVAVGAASVSVRTVHPDGILDNGTIRGWGT